MTLSSRITMPGQVRSGLVWSVAGQHAPGPPYATSRGTSPLETIVTVVDSAGSGGPVADGRHEGAASGSMRDMPDTRARAVSAKYCSSAPGARPRATPWVRPTNSALSAVVRRCA